MKTSIEPPWGLVAIAFGLVAGFLWTNWYFSPERQVQRLADRLVNRSRSPQLLEADAAIWQTSLSPRGAQEDKALIACERTSCDVTVYRLFTFFRPELSFFTLEVTVTLEPRLVQLNATSILPAKVAWAPTEWRWHVKIVSTDETAPITAFHGSLNELSEVPRPAGSDVLAKYIDAMAAEMSETLDQR